MFKRIVDGKLVDWSDGADGWVSISREAECPLCHEMVAEHDEHCLVCDAPINHMMLFPPDESPEGTPLN